MRCAPTANCCAAILRRGCRWRSSIRCSRSAMPSWLLLQLADSAFPTGGFAHFAGLEAAMHAGTVELDGFAREALWQAGHGSLPLVTAAHREPSRMAVLDARDD